MKRYLICFIYFTSTAYKHSCVFLGYLLQEIAVRELKKILDERVQFSHSLHQEHQEQFLHSYSLKRNDESVNETTACE